MKSKRPARTPPPETCCTASSHPRRCGSAIDCGARSAKSVRRCTLIRRIVGCHIANGWSNRRPPAIARLLASYGDAFELTGSEQFKRRAIALMVENGIDARLSSKKRCGVPKQRPQRSKRSVVPVNPEGAVRRVEYWDVMDGVSVSVYSRLRYYLCYRGRVMVTATSIKLDDELKGRVQHLAESRRRTRIGSCAKPLSSTSSARKARGAEPGHAQGMG